jgi:E3 ubiquitin-protein ligase HACE1
MDGCTPLLVALLFDKLSCFEALVELKADVNLSQDQGMTPLHILASEGNSSLIKALVTKKADVNARDR